MGFGALGCEFKAHVFGCFALTSGLGFLSFRMSGLGFRLVPETDFFRDFSPIMRNPLQVITRRGALDPETPISLNKGIYLKS